MRKQRRKKRIEKAGENKKTQTKANFENRWEMEAELGGETFLSFFVPVQRRLSNSFLQLSFFFHNMRSKGG